MRICGHLACRVADAADQILLPTVAREIQTAKSTGTLHGDSPEKRYDSFFTDGTKWNSAALSLPQNYPCLMEMVRILISTTIRNVCRCIALLTSDLGAIQSGLFSKPPGVLAAIDLLDSDRHRQGLQAVLLTFSSGQSVVYKPTDVRPDQLLSDFVDQLALPPTYFVSCMKALPMDGYGWLQYVQHQACRTRAEVRRYYRRAGALLAIADALHYTDGHTDNLIAHRDEPVLIDCETLFQVYEDVPPDVGERSILFTGLVEKPPTQDSGRGFTAALQTPPVGRFEFLSPYALEDHTDTINVHFRGFSNKRANNCPVLRNVYQTPHSYITEFIEAFSQAYDHVSALTDQLLANEQWWGQVASVRARQLIRHTLYYELLSRRVQQPECCKDRHAALAELASGLRSGDRRLDMVSRYEMKSLLELDIPYFYHYPGSTELVDGDDTKYPGYWRHSAIDEMRYEFSSRSAAYRNRSIAILRNILPHSPRVEREGGL